MAARARLKHLNMGTWIYIHIYIYIYIILYIIYRQVYLHMQLQIFLQIHPVPLHPVEYFHLHLKWRMAMTIYLYIYIYTSGTCARARSQILIGNVLSTMIVRAGGVGRTEGGRDGGREEWSIEGLRALAT